VRRPSAVKGERVLGGDNNNNDEIKKIRGPVTHLRASVAEPREDKESRREAKTSNGLQTSVGVGNGWA